MPTNRRGGADWQSTIINAQLLKASALGIGTIIAAFVGFQHWDDNRNRLAVKSYVNEFVNPRLDSLERSMKRQTEINIQVMEMIETQDHSRNRQYGEMKSNQEKMLESLRSLRKP